MVSSLYLDEIWIETFFLHRDLLHLEGAGDVELSNQPQEQRPCVTGQLFLNSGQEWAEIDPVGGLDDGCHPRAALNAGHLDAVHDGVL